MRSSRLETLFAGILNANNRFAAAAGAPILLNLSIIATLLLTPFFPDAGHAAAWGVLVAGVLHRAVVGGDAEMHGIGIRFRMPRLDEPTRRFLKALGPAIIGAGGVQLALFADTLIASYLPTGALSALYYADRINQLPIGVVGIAVGTVLLPEMSRRLAAGDEKGAASAQARGIQLALLLTIPCAGELDRHPRSYHARAIRSRRFHRNRCRRGWRHARRLRLRATALRAAPELHLAVLCARRYGYSGEGRPARREHQYLAEGFADGPARSGRDLPQRPASAPGST